MTSNDQIVAGGRQVERNVLFLSEVINCNDGIASYCQTLAEGLKARGVHVVLVTGLVRSDDASTAKRSKIDQSVKAWHVMDGIGKIPTPALVRKVLEIIRANDIRVVNVHGLGMLMWGRALTLTRKIRVVATYHPSVLGSMATARQAPQATFGLAQKLFFNVFFPDALVIMSEESRRHLMRYAWSNKARIVKVFGGVDIEYFRPPTATERFAARERFGLVEGDIVCLLAARLAWVKGHDLLIGSVRDLRRRRPDLAVRCLFVGSGGREEEIKDFAWHDEADRASFQFLGFMSDVREALWASDIFILPSRFEGFPMGVAEAMSAGLVTIRTPAGGASDQIVPSRTGLIVPFEDMAALSGAIEELAKRDRREEMQPLTIERARNLFGMTRMVDKIIDVYGLN